MKKNILNNLLLFIVFTGMIACTESTNNKESTYEKDHYIGNITPTDSLIIVATQACSENNTEAFINALTRIEDQNNQENTKLTTLQQSKIDSLTSVCSNLLGE